MKLTAQHLSFSYAQGAAILDDVSLEVNSGESLCILGPNGAGKSTLLMCLINALTPDSGSVELDGVPVSSMSARAFARGVAYVPQSITARYDYPVRDWVVMGQAPHLGHFRHPGAREYAIVDEVLADLEISQLADRPITKLSGGERQQAALARALVQRPEILVLDEPTSALDFGNQQRTLGIIDRLLGRGFSVVMTTHAPNQALRLGGRVALVGPDLEFSCGQASGLLTGERLSRLYATAIRVVDVPGLPHKVCVPG